MRPTDMLRQPRDGVFEACAAGQLESGGLRHILSELGMDMVMQSLRVTNGLAFSFLRGDANHSRARRDLAEAIDVMVTRPAIDRALAAATQAFGTSTDAEAFAEQQRLSLERQAAERRLMELMQPDEG